MNYSVDKHQNDDWRYKNKQEEIKKLARYIRKEDHLDPLFSPVYLDALLNLILEEE